ncbi:MAG: hypothetical protein WKG07_27610 [Hymenobacter sp.]
MELSYLIAEKALQKVLQPGRQRSLPTIITTLIFIPLLIFMIVSIGGTVAFSYPHRPFNQQQWAASENNRYEMVDNLLDFRKLLGLSKKQVATILGEPVDFEGDEWLYELGYEPGSLHKSERFTYPISG